MTAPTPILQKYDPNTALQNQIPSQLYPTIYLTGISYSTGMSLAALPLERWFAVPGYSDMPFWEPHIFFTVLFCNLLTAAALIFFAQRYRLHRLTTAAWIPAGLLFGPLMILVFIGFHARPVREPLPPAAARLRQRIRVPALPRPLRRSRANRHRNLRLTPLSGASYDHHRPAPIRPHPPRHPPRPATRLPRITTPFHAIFFKTLIETCFVLFAAWILLGVTIIAILYSESYGFTRSIKHYYTLMDPLATAITLVACAIFGFVLGFIQFRTIAGLDQWALLIHRPLRARRLFVNMLLSGLILYSAFTLIPLLLFIVWAVGDSGRPRPISIGRSSSRTPRASSSASLPSPPASSPPNTKSAAPSASR